jgi:FkbM family methyltransferase
MKDAVYKLTSLCLVISKKIISRIRQATCSTFMLLVRKAITAIRVGCSVLIFKTKYPLVPIITPFKFNSFCYLTYYSQSGQDVYLSSLLFNILVSSSEDSYIIDIGCNHPEHFSNSFFFEKYFGCKTIAIDPLGELEPLWNSIRPNATFISSAIGTSEGPMILRIPNDQHFNNMFSYLEGSAAKFAGQDFNERTVEVRRLSSILDSFGINEILFVSIDVEGFEMEVLQSINFDSVEIKCFLIENNSSDLMGSEDIRSFLHDRGFMFYARFGYLDDLFINRSYYPIFMLNN